MRRALAIARLEFYMCRWHGYGLTESIESAAAAFLKYVRRGKV